MEAMVLDKLSKEYHGSGFTVGPISIRLDSGDSLALFGKNGAGKSTLFQMVTGNLDSTSGVVKLFGEEMTTERFDLKKKVGYMPQHLGLPRWVTGKEILSYAADLYALADSDVKISQSLAYWDCELFQNRPMGSCSHGMQKRLSLALASIHEPELLILDEPFSGLDIIHIRALEDMLLSRRRRGLSTILCTHIVPYAAKLCQKAAILDSGNLKLLESWDEMDGPCRVALVEDSFSGMSD